MDRSFGKNFVKCGISLIICMSMMLFAGKDKELFLRGNKYYEHYDYDNALQSYNKMSKKGQAVLYNMGNCFYHKDDYAQALVYWTRAQEGATTPERAIIDQNKEEVFKKIGKKNDQSSIHIIKDYINVTCAYCSLFFLQLLFILLFCIGILMWLRRYNYYAKLILISLLPVITGIAIMLSIYYVHSDVIYAIVVKKDAVLFSVPDKEFHVLSPVAYAHEVIVKESRQGWRKIRFNDTIGWVEADVIQII